MSQRKSWKKSAVSKRISHKAYGHATTNSRKKKANISSKARKV